MLHEGSTGTISVIYTTSVHNGGTGWVAKFTSKVPGTLLPYISRAHVYSSATAELKIQVVVTLCSV